MDESVCSVEGCDRPIHERRLCVMHYTRWHRTGDAGEAASRRQPAAGQTCRVDGCVNPVIAKGICNVHRMRLRQLGRLDLPPPSVRPSCSFPGCPQPHYGQGWCKKHYRRWRENGDPDGRRPYGQLGCSIPSCASPHYAKTWCQLHYERWLRLGDPGEPGRLYSRPYSDDTRCRRATCDRPVYARGVCQVHYTTDFSQPMRRARERNAAGYAIWEQVEARIAFYGESCWMCGAPMECLDHVKPLAAGGSAWPSNLRPACRSCNARKARRWPLSAEMRVLAARSPQLP